MRVDQVTVSRYWKLSVCGFEVAHKPFVRKTDAEAFAKLINLAIKNKQERGEDCVHLDDRAWVGLSRLVLDEGDSLDLPLSISVVPVYEEIPLVRGMVLTSVLEAIGDYGKERHQGQLLW